MNQKKKTLETKSLEFYLDLKYPITLHAESEGGYVVEIKDLPGCISQGESIEEAMKNIEEARLLWIETAYEYGDKIPLPASQNEYSGKILLRMPRSLHQQLAETSEQEGVSLNQYIVMLLSARNREIALKQKIHTP